MACTIKRTQYLAEQKNDFSEVKEQILAIAASVEEETDVTIELDQGRYTLEEPFVLDAEEHPGLAKIRLTIKGKNGMRPYVSGLKFVSGADFVPVEGTPYYKYQLPAKADGSYPKFHDFFRGDKRLTMARSEEWRNPTLLTPALRKGEEDMEGLYVPVELAERAKAAWTASTELRIYVQWQQFILRIKEIDTTVEKEFNGKKYALMRFYEEFDEHFVRGVHPENNIGNRETYFLNNPAFLSEPDSFAYDWHTGTVYVTAPEGKSVAGNRYGYTELESLFVFKGMKDVRVEGILFTGLTSSYVCNTGYFGTLSNREFRVGKLRQAAVLAMSCRGLTVTQCGFHNLGSNGVQLFDRTINAEISDCVFRDIAMGGVAIGNYREGNGWADARNQTYNVRVLNNYFEHIAYQYPSTACIFIGFVDGATISHNTINGCAYSGIAAGDGYSLVNYEIGELVNLRDVEISYNEVRDFMDVCRDGGAIYVTGANCTVNCADRFNSIHHNAAFLANRGTADRRGYYLDGAASNWDVYDNMIDNCVLPLFTQYHCVGQFTHHNRVWNFYSTTWVDPVGNNQPQRDTLLGFYGEADSLEELYEKYPAAKAIADGAGCKYGN
ncbi:MAG: right-handed parallel beta-helix repeat-containing protein [Clostridia bacterium]|nr:right-handed parallel beta-helix repeat-containing protein [Clostridia bacterium]